MKKKQLIIILFATLHIFTGLNVFPQYAFNKTDKVIANKPFSLDVDNVIVTNVTTCYGDNNGTITIMASGGSEPYEYSIDNGANYQTDNFFENLTADTYDGILVKDAIGTIAMGWGTITQPDELFIHLQEFTNITGCPGDETGTITITATGGTGELYYSINNGVNFFDNGGYFTGLASGVYQIKVKDLHECSVSGYEQITINEPTSVGINSVVSSDVIMCYGDAGGTIAIIASGGTLPLKYSIDNGENYELYNYFSELTAGEYPVVVTDGAGCTVVGETITIGQPEEIIIESITNTDADSCFNMPTGSITVIASGGTGIFLNYRVEGGSPFVHDNVFENLYAGVYEVVVRDDHLCTISGGTVTINEPPEFVLNYDTNTNIEGCFGDSTGTIEISVSGGTPGYWYSIDQGDTFHGTMLSTSTFTGLPTGTYSVQVKDANECTLLGSSHLINQPIQIIIYQTHVLDVNTCFNDNTGTITTFAYGGTGTLEYTVNGIDYFQDNVITGLYAGTYIAKVKDANECEVFWEEEIIVEQPNEIEISNIVVQNPTCYGASNGQIAISATGGTGDLQYSINGGIDYNGYSVIIGLSAGSDYSIMIKDGNNCIVEGGSYELIDPPELIIDDIYVEDVSSCFGESNGSITITGSGGTGQIWYAIDGGIVFSENSTFTGLAGGNYHIVLEDENDCNASSEEPIVISQPELLLISNQYVTDILGCNGEEIGEIIVNTTGGTEPITYTISSGSFSDYNTTGTFSDLSAGIYIINVQDYNNCTTNEITIEVNEPDELSVDISSIVDISCYNEIDGYIALTTLGGEPFYQYSINGGDYTYNPFFYGLAAGIYQFSVIDEYGCVRYSEEAEITEPDSLMITDVQFADIELCYGDNTGIITISVEGGVPEYMYSVNYGNLFFNENEFTELTAGDYNIIVIDQNNCETNYNTTITLTQPPEIEITEIEITNISCYGYDDGTITITADGGTEFLEYSVNGGETYQTNSFFNGLSQGDYEVTIIDANDCVVSNYGTIYINEPDLLYFYIVNTYYETCIGSNDGIIEISTTGGTLPIQYALNDGEFQESNTFENLMTGEYIPIIKDENGCTTISNDTYKILSPESSAGFNTDINSGCSPLSVELYRFSEVVMAIWDFDDSTPIDTVLNDTIVHIFENNTLDSINYTINLCTVSTSMCNDTSYHTITVYPRPTFDIVYTPDTLYYPETTVNIENISPDIYTNYFWDFDDGTNSTEEQPISHNYDTCGVFKISIDASNKWCSGTSIFDMNITTNQPEAIFEIDTTNGCTPFVLNLSNKSVNANSYSWSLGDGTYTNETNPTHTYSEPETYDIMLSALGYCGTSSVLDTTINVWESPMIDFNVEPDSVMAPRQPIHCYNYLITDNFIYFWDFGDGNTSSETEPIHYYKSPGWKDITLYVTSDKKCTNSFTFENEVFVSSEGYIRIPDAFMPNGDGKNDIFKPSIYESISEYDFTIFNRWGEKIFQSKNIEEGWDGYYNGKLCMQDVYVWKIIGVYRNGQIFEKVGNVTLIR